MWLSLSVPRRRRRVAVAGNLVAVDLVALVSSKNKINLASPSLPLAFFPYADPPLLSPDMCISTLPPPLQPLFALTR
jgi:hypothetical protein